MDVKELGRLFRKRYPEYRHKTDEDIGWAIVLRHPEIGRRLGIEIPEEGGKIMIPYKWDEVLISQTLQLYRDKPAVLAHFIDSIKDRFITGQDIQTTRRRKVFLDAQIELLDSAIRLSETARKAKRVKTEQDTLDVEAATRLAEALRKQQEREILSDLELQAKIEKLKTKTAKHIKKRHDLEKEPESKEQLNPDEERRQRKSYWQAEIERLQKEKEGAVKVAKTEEERVEIENMYDDAIQGAREQMRKYL